MRVLIGTAVLAAVVSICSPAARGASSEPTLEEVRALTSKYRDIKVAIAEGYIASPGDMCETAPMMGFAAKLGGMGVHYFRPDLLGITTPPNPRVAGTGTHTDFRKPAILIYKPMADGSMELVAVENLVFKKAWHAAGNTSPPTFHGIEYDSMQDDPDTAIDEAHMFEPHYDRHVWVHRANARGTFAQFNPSVTCKGAAQSASAHANHASHE